MNSRLAKELDEQLLGTVSDASDALDYFATDGSIFTIRPEVVVYPKHTTDVRRTLAHLNDEAQAGRKIGIVARGKGTDQAGGALGDGVMLVLPAFMNKVLKLGRKTITVQPGILYGELQKTLKMHARFLPPYPSSIDFSTIGGAVANNACGEKTVKYGSTRDYVTRLKVVLANGELIETKRLTKRQVAKKKKQGTLEGKIYGQIDDLLRDNALLIAENVPDTSKNAAGYALWRARGRDGSIDLSQLIIGSQGTLGVITEVTLKTEQFNPKTSLTVAYFDSLEKAGEAVVKLQSLKPSALEIVDYYLLDFLKKNRPAQIKGLVPEELPKVALFIEFDDFSQLKQTYKAQRVQLILKKLAYDIRQASDPLEQEKLWAIRHSAAAVIWKTKGSKKALPVIEDGVVPADKLPEFLEKVYRVLKKHKLEFAVWGHAGDANLHLQPFMDLGKAPDREKVFQLADDFYNMVIEMGGSTCGEHNDGLMRAMYLEKLYGKEVYDLFRQVKDIFDPHGILNPNKKIGVTKEYVKPLVRKEYSMQHLHDHMPRT